MPCASSPSAWRKNPRRTTTTMLITIPRVMRYRASYSRSSSPFRGNRRFTSVNPGRKRTRGNASSSTTILRAPSGGVLINVLRGAWRRTESRTLGPSRTRTTFRHAGEQDKDDPKEQKREKGKTNRRQLPSAAEEVVHRQYDREESPCHQYDEPQRPSGPERVLPSPLAILNRQSRARLGCPLHGEVAQRNDSQYNVDCTKDVLDLTLVRHERPRDHGEGRNPN